MHEEGLIGTSDDNLFANYVCASGSSETRTVHPKWVQICNEINIVSLSSVPVIRYKQASIGTRKPGTFLFTLHPLWLKRIDVPFYLKGKPKTEFYMSIVGELKGDLKSDHFGNEDKGQLASFLNALLSMTVRQHVFGFLCDGNLIQFFKGINLTNNLFGILIDMFTSLYLF